jgi:type VI secretion system protein VasD
MATPRAALAPLALALYACVVAACANKPPPKPAVAAVTVAARADVNPDATGRPSPIVVRFYQLKADAGFLNADFFGLFDDDKRALGADVSGREELELAPGETRSLELGLAPETRFVGALAAYRDIRAATWRALVPAAGAKQKSIKVQVMAERAQILLSVAP